MTINRRTMLTYGAGLAAAGLPIASEASPMAATAVEIPEDAREALPLLLEWWRLHGQALELERTHLLLRAERGKYPPWHMARKGNGEVIDVRPAGAREADAKLEPAQEALSAVLRRMMEIEDRLAEAQLPGSTTGSPYYTRIPLVVSMRLEKDSADRRRRDEETGLVREGV